MQNYCAARFDAGPLSDPLHGDVSVGPHPEAVRDVAIDNHVARKIDVTGGAVDTARDAQKRKDADPVPDSFRSARNRRDELKPILRNGNALAYELIEIDFLAEGRAQTRSADCPPFLAW